MNSTGNDDVTERLGALAQWHPHSSVEAATVVRTGRRRRTTRVAGMGGLAALAVVATTVSALTLGGGGGTAPAATTPLATQTAPASYDPPGSARAAMAAAAPDPVKAQDESSWADAPYWYVKLRGHYAEQEPAAPEGHGQPAEDYVQEEWAGHHSYGLVVRDGTVLSDTWQGGWTRADFDRATDGNAWDASFALPTDPDALEAALRAAVPMVPSGGWTPGPDAPTQDDRVWQQIRDIYPGSPAPTALRLAFMQVAEGLSDITLTPGVADGEGRVGLAISRPNRVNTDAGMTTLIVDPADGTVLEMRDSLPADDPNYRVTYLAMGPVWSLPER